VFALVSSSKISILDSFTDYGSPFHSTQSGPVSVEGLDVSGNVLFSAAGQLHKIHPEDALGSIQVSVPLPDDEVSRLSQLRVSYDGVSQTRRSLPYAPPSASAVAIDAKRIKVSFDGRHFALLFVRDSTAKQTESTPINAYAGIDSGGVVWTTAADVYCDFSDGIKTVATHVKIHVQGR
jgi:hypothetical protein